MELNFYYIFPIILSIIVTLFYKNKKAAYLIFWLLFFFHIFRGDKVGHDTLNYQDANAIAYLATTDYSFEDLGAQSELISLFINKIVYFGNLHPRWIIIFYSLLTFLFLYKALRNFRCLNHSFILLFYVLTSCYYFSLSATRQMASSSVLLYAYSFLQYSDRRKYYFLVWTLVASLIHSTSIIFILTYFSSYFSFKRSKIALWVFVISAVLYINPINFLDIALNILGSSKMERYVFSYADGAGLSIKGVIASWIILVSSMYFFYKYKTTKTDTLDNVFLIAIMLSALFANQNGLISRFTYSILPVIGVGLGRYIPTNLNGIGLILYLIMIAVQIYTTGSFGTSSLEVSYYLNF